MVHTIVSTFGSDKIKTNKMAEEQIIQTEVAAQTETAPLDTQQASVNETANTQQSAEQTESNAAPASETQEATQSAAHTPSEDEVFKQLLAKQGISFEDVENIKIAKAKEQEEKEAPLREQKEWADIVAFGVQNNIISKDDVVSYETISKADDKTLVFEKFKSEYKNEEGLTDEELDEAIAADFEDEYNLATTNEKARNRAESILKAEAERIRNEKTNVFKAAQTQYQQAKSVKGLREQHDQILKEFESATTETQEFEIDGEKIQVQVPIKVDSNSIREQLKSAEGGALLSFMHNIYKENPKASEELFRQFVKANAIDQKVYTNAVVNAVMTKMDETYKQKYTVGSRAPFNSRNNEKLETVGNSELDVYRRYKK